MHTRIQFIRPQIKWKYFRRAEPVEKIVAQYKQKWLNHVSRMEDIRHPIQLLDYWPMRRQRPGWPLKRLLDGYNCEAKTGHLWPNYMTWRRRSKIRVSDTSIFQAVLKTVAETCLPGKMAFLYRPPNIFLVNPEWATTHGGVCFIPTFTKVLHLSKLWDKKGTQKKSSLNSASLETKTFYMEG